MPSPARICIVTSTHISANPRVAKEADALKEAGVDGHVGFDAEDFHTGESNSSEELARVDFIQSRYLPQCSFVTAASAGIADALSQRYSVAAPLAVYNTFPWDDRDTLDHCIKDRRGNALSLYWYSQTVGLDRGIQDAIRAAGLLQGKIQLHVRGTIALSVRCELESVARESGVAGQIHFHPQVAPRDLLSRAAEHDVGLALEQGAVLNRRICTTNKLFLYLLAGVAAAGAKV